MTQPDPEVQFIRRLISEATAPLIRRIEELEQHVWPPHVDYSHYHKDSIYHEDCEGCLAENWR